MSAEITDELIERWKERREVDKLIEALAERIPYEELLLAGEGPMETHVFDRRAAVALALGEIGDKKAVMPLIDLLHTIEETGGDGNVTRGAVSALGDIGDERAVEHLEHLVRGLEDSDRTSGQSICWALAKIGGKRATDALAEALGARNEHVRYAAAEALYFGHIKDSSLVEPLIGALGDIVPGVRVYAVGALGEIGDARAVDALGKMLRSRDPSMSAHAARALGMIGDASAVGPLTEALSDERLSDEHQMVRDVAEAALSQMDVPSRKLGGREHRRPESDMAGLAKIRCPQCGARLRVRPGSTTRRVRCPRCQASFAVRRRAATGADEEPGYVRDQVTGLLWQRKHDGQRRSHQEAVAYCRTLRLGGLTGWELPTRSEYRDLFQHTECWGSLSKADDVFWTATEFEFAPDTTAYASDGTTFWKSNKYYVRAVLRSVSAHDS